MNFNWQRIIIFLLLCLLKAKQNSSFVFGNKKLKTSSRAIVFPEDNYDDCVMDYNGLTMQPGECKFVEECPEILKKWQVENIYPKTCYFLKQDQYVCCPKASKIVATTSSPLANSSTEINYNTAAPITPGSNTEPPLPSLSTLPIIFETSTKSFFDEIFEGQRPSESECELNQVVRTSVVHGLPTEVDEFPFMAALGWTSNAEDSVWYRCGGAVISSSYILTAAHCAEIGGSFANVVRVGGINLTDSTVQDSKIKRFISHPEYDAKTIQNDIALVELETPLTRFSVACLWLQPDLPSENVTALGYGHTRFGGVASEQLLKAPLKVVTQDFCNDYYRESGDIGKTMIIDSHLCANDPKELRDTCQGDSGGPLIMENRHKRAYVVGITSFGLGCAGVPPSIYTRVSSYVDWIEGIVWPKVDTRNSFS